MVTCVRCGKNEEEIRLFDGFYGVEPVKICERCSIISNIPIIKRPSADQLKESEKAYSVRQRLNFMKGVKPEEKKNITLGEELKNIEKMPERERPEDLVFKLVDNFHWIIQTQRRRKGFTTKQMADIIGESESALKMLEKGLIPTKSLGLIEKIEQFLSIRIIKKDAFEKMKEEANMLKNKPQVIEYRTKLLENPEKNPLGTETREDHLRKMRKEEGDDMIKEAIIEEKNPVAKGMEEIDGTPLRMGDFRSSKIKSLTIADLKRIDEEVERDFEVEEQKTKQQIGDEQFENFGKEDTEKLKKKVYRGNYSPTRISKNKVPTIYDLMKAKSEKEKMSIVGKDIRIEEADDSVYDGNEEFEM